MGIKVKKPGIRNGCTGFFLWIQRSVGIYCRRIFLIPLLSKGDSLPPFVKGGAAVQSLITYTSEALRLWRRTVGRDLRDLFLPNRDKQTDPYRNHIAH
jgi:hypothetical protein